MPFDYHKQMLYEKAFAYDSHMARERLGSPTFAHDRAVGSALMEKGIVADPDFKRFTPRKFQTVPGYHSSYTAGLNLAIASKYEIMNLSCAASQIVENGVQLFWLGNELAQSISQTSLPDNLNLKDVPLPFDAYVLLLPDAFMVHPEDGTARAIWVYRATALALRDVMTTHDPKTHPEINNEWLERGSLIIGIQFEKNGLYYICSEKQIYLDQTFKEAEESCGTQPYMTAIDENNLDVALRLVVNSAFIISSRPELLERGEMVKKIKSKQGGKIGLYSPRWIGRTYRIKKDDSAVKGTHESPCTHWRRGHWRNQAVGGFRKEHRLIWIEPMLVAGPKSLEKTA